MLTQKLVTQLFVILLVIAGTCQGQDLQTTATSASQETAPSVKYMEYGFDVLDFVRGIKEKIDIELSTTVNSKHIWNGIDAFDDHGVIIPSVKMTFGDSGLSGMIMESYPLSSGLENSVQRNFALFYTGAILQDTSWATNYVLNWWYYGLPNISDGKSDSQEFGSTLFWPGLIPVSYGSLTPSYYLSYIWASRSNSNIKECEGFIHVLGLNYDFDIPNFWPDGTKQSFRLHGDFTYNDGFAASAIEHEWSHLTLAINTKITKENWTITPSLNYQISMEDSVNPENEFWCGINATYKF